MPNYNYLSLTELTRKALDCLTLFRGLAKYLDEMSCVHLVKLGRLSIPYGSCLSRLNYKFKQYTPTSDSDSIRNATTKPSSVEVTTGKNAFASTGLNTPSFTSKPFITW